MALVNSFSLPQLKKMPAFSLPNPDGLQLDSSSIMRSHGLLVIFTCNHCPYAMAIWPRLIRLATEVIPMGMGVVAINPNIHPDYPDDSPDEMRKKMIEWHIPFPYLIDETQAVAKQYNAQCTPDLYLLNTQYELVYHGQLDDNWKEETKVHEQSLKIAIGNLIDGLPIDPDQHPSMGCSIKWKE